MCETIRYHEVDVKTLIRRQVAVDPWFLGRFGSNVYRGCEHGCVYCDGRAEKYYVIGTFDRDIQVKRNALSLARKEMPCLREPGIFFLGGGVCDAYQPAEKHYKLARGLLELCYEKGIPVHVLTKSVLVERDLDLLAKINGKTRAILSFSIALTDEQQRKVFEPRAAPLAERWRLITQAKALGLATGVMAMPTLPGISDSPEQVAALVKKAAEHGVDFLLHGGLTLRPGIQQEGYFRLIQQRYPELWPGYQRLFRFHHPSGMPQQGYAERLDRRYREALLHYSLPGRMPWRLFHGFVPLYTELAVLLEHHGYQQGETLGHPGVFSRSGWAVSQWAQKRLSHQRSKSAYRLVESELIMLIHSRQFQEIPHLDPESIPSILEIFKQVIQHP